MVSKFGINHPELKRVAFRIIKIFDEEKLDFFDVYLVLEVLKGYSNVRDAEKFILDKQK